MWQSRQHEVVPLIFRLRISGLLSFNTSMQPSVNDCNDMSSVFVWYVSIRVLFWIMNDPDSKTPIRHTVVSQRTGQRTSIE